MNCVKVLRVVPILLGFRIEYTFFLRFENFLSLNIQSNPQRNTGI